MVFSFYATDVENAWTGFNDIFMSILNSIAPVKEVIDLSREMNHG